MQGNSRGLFLDLDGTLADSLTVLRRVYFRFLEKFGFAGSDAEFDRLNGPKLSEVMARLHTFITCQRQPKISYSRTTS